VHRRWFLHPDLSDFGHHPSEQRRKSMNIYLIGVGGQGIGLLAEVLLRAGDHAGLPVKGVDTHGLAQRGGIVISHLRLGSNAHSPLIMEGEADVVVALERHEAFRAASTVLKPGGVLMYYDAVWQPLEVRLNQAPEVTEAVISDLCGQRNIRMMKVFKPDLESANMQNVVLLAHICKNRLIPGVEKVHLEKAMEDLMEGHMLEKNRNVFNGESREG
jgi:indolepyruvate ferredoxin oxidoreductase beta subunit